MKKRILAILLTLCLLLSLAPTAAFAAEGSAENAPAAELTPAEGPGELMGAPDTPPVAYGSWQNAAVLTPGTPASFVLDTYNSNYTDPQVWLAVTVDADDLAIQMELFLPGYSQLSLYDAATLKSEGPTYSNMLNSLDLSGERTVSWKVPYAGVYYLMLRPAGEYAISDQAGSLTISLLDGDTNEPNDTKETAAALTVNVDTIYNLNGSNDEDWFKITTEKAGQAVKVVLTGFNYETNPVRASLYNGTNEYALTSRDYISKDTEFYWKAGEPADYYLKLTPYSSSQYTSQPLKVRFELVDGDANELNDAWQDAAVLSPETTAYYTLTGSNDVDWFKLTTTVPGEAIKISLGGFDYTSNLITARLYSGAVLETYPDDLSYTQLYSRETRNDLIFRWKANEPGDYYLALQLSDSGSDKVNLRDHSVRFQLVSGDEYELNDDWQSAAAIPQDDYEMEFNLNGDNDTDWFKFETSLENDVVTLSLRDFETDYSNFIRFYVYDVNELGETTTLTYDDVSITHTKTFVCPTPGTHYICIRPYHDQGGSFENLLKLKIEHRSLSIDEGEPNDTWQQAAAVNLDVATVFNLPAGTDVDWFKFEMTEPNQTLDLRLTIPAGAPQSIGTAVYSETELNKYGENASSILSWNDNINGPKTYRAMLGEPGVYYVRLDGGNFEEDATVTCSLLPPDRWEDTKGTGENNNYWKRAAAIPEGVANEYTLPARNDTDWFKITTNEPNQTVEIVLDIPVNGTVYCALWSGDDLWTLGDNAANLFYQYYESPYYYYQYFTSGVNTLRWMLGDAGDYYIRLYPDDDNSIIDSGATITYRLIEPDGNEGNLSNNTWQNAAALTEGVAAIFTRPAPNDDDWFKFTALEDNQTLELELTVPVGDTFNSIQVYSGTDLNAVGIDRCSPIGYININGYNHQKNRCMLGKAGDYYIHVSPGDFLEYFDRDATLTYRMLPPDANERNNEWQDATPLTPQAAVSFTLPAYNDRDWFYLGHIDAGDDFSLVFDGMPAYHNLVYYVAYKGEYDASPGGSYPYTYTYSFSQTSQTFNAEKTGDYYLCTYVRDSTWTDALLTVRFSIARDATPVTGLSITSIGGAPTTIFQGKTLGLYPVFKPANASNQNVTWASKNEEVATIDQNGLVTAIAPGTAIITCTAEDGGIEATCTVTVAEPVPVTGVSVTSGDIHQEGETAENPKLLSLGTALQLAYTTAPENATEQAVTWTVSDPEVLSVTDYGKVAAVGSGRARVTVTTVEGGFTADYYIYVPDQTYAVSRVTLDAVVATLYMDEEGLDLAATVHPSYATNQNVIWSSSDESVAAVDALGHVTAVAPGEATITAAAQENPSLKSTCLVTVQPKRVRVESIGFASDTVEIGLYVSISLAPVIEPANATDKSVGWTTSNKNIVTVSRNGVITGLNLGLATITATTSDGGKVATVTVLVTAGSVLGDLNNDGAVDSGDALMVLRASVGLLALTEAQKSVADVNGDGDIDAGDAVLILRYDAGLINEFPKK